MFRQWARCRDEMISSAGLKSSLGGVRSEVERLLQRGLHGSHDKTSRFYEQLLHHRERLWTFLDQSGVEPTNNASERALRHAVIWRKLSFGTQSAAGRCFVETLLSVIETCRLQHRDPFASVTPLTQNQPPSLLPGA